MIGLGSNDYDIALYIANRPPIDDYPELDCLKPLTPGEVDYIVQQTGNHWRKIFNVSAKLLFQLDSKTGTAASWQQYRDELLFQYNNRAALLFSAPDLSQEKLIHIICGKTYAQQLPLPELIWLDPYFAINPSQRLIVCPYLDYRQLSNIRIERLLSLIQQLKN